MLQHIAETVHPPEIELRVRGQAVGGCADAVGGGGGDPWDSEEEVGRGVCVEEVPGGEGMNWGEEGGGWKLGQRCGG